MEEVRVAPVNPLGYSLQQTMLRIKDPKISVPFYCEYFGFRLLAKFDFPQWKFSVYFLGIPPPGEDWPADPESEEAETCLFSMKFSCLELTHNHGSEDDAAFAVSSGNVEPYRGFGHIAVMTPDVYAACAKLEAAGVRFQKRPDEGRMKGIAFALDPDGYWIEVISRAPASPVTSLFSLAQTMLRVKDAPRALAFYTEQLGMSLLRTSHHADFSLYFLAHLPPGTPLPALPDSPDASDFIKRMFPQVLELTHNHGTELQPQFAYHNGNDTDAGQVRGFGHIGFLVDDLDAACQALEAAGACFKKRPHEGAMRGLAFVYDADGYWVELIQRGFRAKQF